MKNTKTTLTTDQAARIYAGLCIKAAAEIRSKAAGSISELRLIPFICWMSDSWQREQPFPGMTELQKLEPDDRELILQLLLYLSSLPEVPETFERGYRLVPEWRR